MPSADQHVSLLSGEQILGNLFFHRIDGLVGVQLQGFIPVRCQSF